jgi:ubiquinone/menaquinone biosynthesis C-methylase UbiE
MRLNFSKAFKNRIKYFLELRFAPKLSLFLFNYDAWAKLRMLKKFLFFADPDKNKRIIDVGAGSGGFELALGRMDIFIYDNNEESIKEASKQFPYTQKGSGTNIEFNENAFDWAISIHTLEHIPKNERPNFLLELCRIASEGIFLNFPEGEHGTQLCLNFLEALKKNDFESNMWTVEHLRMGLPMLDEIIAIISRQTKFIFRYKLIRNYKIENSFNINVIASKNIYKRYIISPYYTILGYLLRNTRPTVELVLVGAKTEEMVNNIIASI